MSRRAPRALVNPAAAADPGVLELADVGTSGPAHWVIDGYATLFAELQEQGGVDLLLVPVGVGALAAAAARFGAHNDVRVIGVEPVAAACLTTSLAAGRPTAVATPGTTMAGLDCSEISLGAWPSLHHGIDGTVTVTDEEAEAAVVELRDAVALGPGARVVLVATEGRTDLPPPAQAELPPPER